MCRKIPTKSAVQPDFFDVRTATLRTRSCFLLSVFLIFAVVCRCTALLSQLDCVAVLKAVTFNFHHGGK